MVELLLSLLLSAAKLAASSAASEFAKGAGKTAFDALKARLAGSHDINLPPLPKSAQDDQTFALAMKDELRKPEIAKDKELLKLAETLREAILALPSEAQANYAVNIETIRSGGNLLFEAIEGVTAKTATSAGDMTFKNVKAPPGK